jgi:hypothetical protein
VAAQLAAAAPMVVRGGAHPAQAAELAWPRVAAHKSSDRSHRRRAGVVEAAHWRWEGEVG